MSKLFVPLDLETTGVNPKSDKILEAAWVVVDENLVELMPRRSFVVDHKESWMDVFSLLRSNEFVRNMHQESGLIHDMQSSDELMPLWAIADQLRADIYSAQTLEQLPNGEIVGEAADSVHLLGLSVGFDRSFMQAAPEFDALFAEDGPAYERFHHRLFDLSSVKIAFELSGLSIPEVENAGKHRALNDVIEVLKFARAITYELTTMNLRAEGTVF